MDFKKRPFNLFTLIFESIKLSNRTFGALLLMIFLFILFFFCTIQLLIILTTKLILPGITTAPLLAGISTLVFVLIAQYIVSFIFPCTLVNMLAARANKVGTALPECFWKSLLPSVFLFLACILFSIPSWLLNWVSNQFSGGTVKLIYLALIFTFYIPASFTLQAITLRGENPISAIKYSMDLVYRRYLRTTLMLLATWLIPAISAVIIGTGLFLIIPNFFAESFHLANLTLGWWAVFGICGVLFAFSFYVTFCAQTLLFLNLDYGLNRDSFEIGDQVSLQGQSSSTALPVNAGMPVERPKDDVLNPNEQVGMLTTVLPEDAQAHVDSNLNQVFSPEQPQRMQYNHQEEDRMPTIVFDDEMAKEIAKNQEMLSHAKETHDKQDNDGQDNIKLSKR